MILGQFSWLSSSQGYPPQSYYGVFDGHIGVEAATYASVHLLGNIVRQPMFQTDPETAIKKGFKLTDDHFLQKVRQFNHWPLNCITIISVLLSLLLPRALRVAVQQ